MTSSPAYRTSVVFHGCPPLQPPPPPSPQECSCRISLLVPRFHCPNLITFPSSLNELRVNFRPQRVRFSFSGGNENVGRSYGISDTQNLSYNQDDNDGSKVDDESLQTKPFSSNKLLNRLRKYGTSGILSYGILNTVYYLATFCFVWFYVAPTPGRLGFAGAVQRFLKIMAMVWVGSQVTKLARIAGALALAPLVSKGLTWFARKFRFQSEGKAFMAIVGVCIGIALSLFFLVTLLWA